MFALFGLDISFKSTCVFPRCISLFQISYAGSPTEVSTTLDERAYKACPSGSVDSLLWDLFACSLCNGKERETILSNHPIHILS